MAFSMERIKQISMFSTNEEDIILMFATHFRSKNSNGRFVICWEYNRELKENFEKNMKNWCRLNPDANVEKWVRFFLEKPSQTRASDHLSAYLEKIGVKSAMCVNEKLRKSLDGNRASCYLPDLYQIALCISIDSDNFFRSFFKSQRSFETFVYGTMKGKIREKFDREILGIPTKRRSDWALLKRTPRIRLREALINQGYRNPYLNYCLLAHVCFLEIYAPQRSTDNSPLPKPTEEQFQQMANLYNYLAQSSPQVADLSQADQETIEQLLKQCIKAIRWHENRPTTHAVSFNLMEEDENSHPSSETNFDDGVEFLWKQNLHEFMPRLTAFLTELLQRADVNANNLLLLKYGFDLGSRSIVPIFGVDPSTICRRINKETQRILEQVGQWAREDLNVTPDSENLSEIGVHLEDCLKKYYKGLIFESAFQNKWQQLDRESHEMLYLSSMEMDVAAISSQLQLGESQVRQELVTGKQELASAIREWTQNHLNISPDLLNPLADNIADLVQTLIVNFIPFDSI